MRSCKANDNRECQEHECNFYDGNGACTWDNAPLCEFYPDVDEYGHCIESRCSSWDIVLGECTERETSVVAGK